MAWEPTRIVLGRPAGAVSAPALPVAVRALPWARIGLALLFAAPIGLFAFAAWSQRWMSDDGFIYLRVVDQLRAGNGPVFNPGERVEATTSPLWVALLTLASFVFPTVSMPWLAVVFGLALAVGGLALAQWGAHRLWNEGSGRVLLPAGALLIVALPPFWDFATSGLETGLAFAWLGACFWGVASRARDGRSAPAWLPALIGLGPLVRPDFAIYAAALVAAVLLLRPGAGWRGRAGTLGLALALPLAYQVFRMGYYGALAPQPAFAKEAGLANWPQGWRYVVDAFAPYWLFVAIVMLAAIGLPALRSLRERRAHVVVIGAMLAAGLVHGTYVVYVGGDFMHARMLLPALFALAAPFASVRVDTRLGAAATVALVAWAIVCAAALRVPYSGMGPDGIANERGYYVEFARQQHPILRDYDVFPPALLAVLQRDEAERGGVVLLEDRQRVPLRADAPPFAVVRAASIGLYGAIFDTDVYITDAYGLVDPLAGRLALTERGRPGHEKVLPESWVVARFADAGAPLPDGVSASDVAAARAVLSCDEPGRLLDAVSAPLTAERFGRNLLESFRLYRFRIPADPQEAQAQLC